MWVVAFCFGLLISAEGFSSKLVEANHKAEELKRLLNLLENDVNTYQADRYTRRVSDWLINANKKYKDIETELNDASWGFETDTKSKEKSKKVEDVTVKSAADTLKLATEAQKFLKLKHNLPDDLERQLKKFKDESSDPIDPKDVKEKSEIQTRMTGIYSQAKVKVQGKMMSIEPELTELLASSRDYNLLEEAWNGWRTETGKKVRDYFTNLVKYSNIGAKDNGFNTMADVWLNHDYGETKDIEQTFEDLWQEVKPLYQQLHAYVRYQLTKVYPQMKKFKDTIPAHVLGNMWGQQWPYVYELVKPYPDVPEPNYDEILGNFLNKRIDGQLSEKEKLKRMSKDMFEIAEEFYTSIGLFKMTDKFWENSIIVKPEGKDIICHASAWDFFRKDDFRIKMCTNTTMDYFETIHHEMGHIEYYMSYKDQPAIFRGGANGGFHEAIGDTIALSARTRSHLTKIFGIDSQSTDEKTKKELDLNYLMSKALIKVAFLPFGYLIDKWRWDVFRGKITEKDYNKKWWEMRLKYQGIVPPNKRTEEDFDPGAKYHVAASVPYSRYFFSFVTQFLFYDKMCEAAGHTEELHTCDFYRNKNAGKILKDMLQMGASKRWEEAMKVITGQSMIKASSFRKYFKPLEDWLVAKNAELGNKVGWDETQSL